MKVAGAEFELTGANSLKGLSKQPLGQRPRRILSRGARAWQVTADRSARRVIDVAPTLQATFSPERHPEDGAEGRNKADYFDALRQFGSAVGQRSFKCLA